MSSLLNEIARRKKLEKIRGKASTAKPKAQLGVDPKGPTLNEILRSKGLTTRPASAGRKDILRDGNVVFENAHAGMVWEWLGTGGDRERPATKKKPAKKNPAKKKAEKKKPAKKKAEKKKNPAKKKKNPAKKKAAKKKNPAKKKKAAKKKNPAKKKAAKKKNPAKKKKPAKKKAAKKKPAKKKAAKKKKPAKK